MDFYSASIGVKVPVKPVQTSSTLHQQHAELKDQHEKLKKQFASLSETVKVLGESSFSKLEPKLEPKLESKFESKLESKFESKLESKLQAQLQQAHSSKLELAQRHISLQEQYNGLKVTAQTLSQSCKASDEKLFLQGQLHAEKLRLMEVTHTTLKDRCKAMGLSAEQHSLANLRLEERHKSLSNDLAQLAALEMGKDSNQKLQNQKSLQLQASHEREIQALKMEYTERLKNKEAEMASLRSKIETHTTEARLLHGKLNATQSLLKAHPIDPCLNLKAKNILLSSAEILELAHARGGADSMRKCLCEVAEALKDLNRKLDTHRRLSSVWMDKVENHS